MKHFKSHVRARQPWGRVNSHIHVLLLFSAIVLLWSSFRVLVLSPLLSMICGRSNCLLTQKWSLFSVHVFPACKRTSWRPWNWKTLLEVNRGDHVSNRDPWSMHVRVPERCENDEWQRYHRGFSPCSLSIFVKADGQARPSLVPLTTHSGLTRFAFSRAQIFL